MHSPLRIGVLGLSHDHAWDNLPALAAHADATIVAAADPNEPLTTRAAEDYGCKTYESPTELLANESWTQSLFSVVTPKVLIWPFAP